MEPEEIIAAALKGTVKYKYDVGPWGLLGRPYWHDYGAMGKDRKIVYKKGD